MAVAIGGEGRGEERSEVREKSVIRCREWVWCFGDKNLSGLGSSALGDSSSFSHE